MPESASTRAVARASASVDAVDAIHPDEGAPQDDPLQNELRRRALALSTVAHELKTPLAVMAGYTDLLLSGGVGPLNERQRGVLREMQVSGERLLQFVEDFLSFSAV